MCFHTPQTKFALEVEIRFNATIGNTLAFKTSSLISGFDYPSTQAIIDKNRPSLEITNV